MVGASKFHRFFSSPEISDDILTGKKKITQQISLVLLGIISFYFALMLYLGYHLTAISLIPGVTYYGCYWLFRKTNSWIFSRQALVVVNAAQIFYFAGLDGKGSGVLFFLYASAGLIPVMFSRKEKLSLAFSVFVLALVPIGLEWTQYNPFGFNVLAPVHSDFLYLLVIPAPYIILGSALFFLVATNSHKEQQQSEIVSELLLRDSLLKDLEKTGMIGYWEFIPSSRKMYWSDQVFRIFQKPFDYPVNLKLSLKLITKESRTLVKDAIRLCLKSQLPFDVHLQAKGFSGNNKWFRVRGHVEEKQGKPIRYCGIIQDVSERMENELAREKQKIQLERIAAKAPGVFFQIKREIDGSFSIPYVSQKAAEVWEMDLETMKADVEKVYSCLHAEDKDSFWKVTLESVYDMRQWLWTGRIITPSGKIKWLRSLGKPEKLPDGSVVWDGIILEITEQKILEQQLEHQKLKALNASKMAALGHMAGGVAHEINNPLAIISGYAYKLRRLHLLGRMTSSEADRMTERILNTGERIKKIVHGLRNFSRDGSKDPLDATPIKQVIDDTLDLCAPRFRNKGVHLAVGDIHPNLNVECRPTEISQVLINLLNNASDAVEKLEGEKWVHIGATQKGSDVLVTVTDSGYGIEKGVLDQMFQPFFTTKEVGKGTGLGLAISMAIIQKHNGSFYVNSEHPRTQFVIRLPLSTSQPIGFVESG